MLHHRSSSAVVRSAWNFHRKSRHCDISRDCLYLHGLRLPFLTPHDARFLSSNHHHHDQQQQHDSSPSTTTIPTPSSTTTTDTADTHHPQPQQRIAIVGAGAVGCYYGARLAVAGHAVHVAVRDVVHREALRRQGNCCHVYSTLTTNGNNNNGVTTAPFAGIHSHAQTMQAYVRRNPATHTFDWVIVTLKTTGIRDVMRSVQSVVDPERTRVILAMNGYGLEQHFAKLRCRTLYGGCVFVCAERSEPGMVFHSGYSGLAAGVERALDPEEDHRGLVEALFAGSAVDVYWETSVLHARWKKALINIPINGLSVVKGDLYVNEIWAHHKDMVIQLMGELALVANADLEERGVPERITQSDIDSTLKIVEGIGPFATSTLVDFQKRVSIEFKWMFRLPYERAQELGLYTPRLQWLVTELSSLREKYRLH